MEGSLRPLSIRSGQASDGGGRCFWEVEAGTEKKLAAPDGTTTAKAIHSSSIWMDGGRGWWIAYLHD